MMRDRAFGPYGWVFWLLMTFNSSFRNCFGRAGSAPIRPLFFVALSANIGMWVERFRHRRPKFAS